ncbi:MAG TPA: hypothetical protein VEA41_06690 [Salinarimonas sp.]|nr:hypothetical protein [Salinarimonas sp.]
MTSPTTLARAAALLEREGTRADLEARLHAATSTARQAIRELARVGAIVPVGRERNPRGGRPRTVWVRRDA